MHQWYFKKLIPAEGSDTDTKHMDSDTNLVAQLKHQLAESQHVIASLQVDTLQNIIVNIQGSASSVALSSSLSVASSSANGNNEQKPCLLLNGTIEEACDHKLDQTEFPSVKSWTKKGWQEQSIPSKHISSSWFFLKKISMWIWTDGARTRTACLYQLSVQRLAPELISQASLDVLKWLVHTLRKAHIELQLCTNNWKIMKLMTDNYPQWHKYHMKKRSSDHVKAEQDLEDESIPDSAPITTQKRKTSEPDNECAIKRSCVDSDIREEVDLTASSTNDIIQDPSPDHEPTPPPSTDKGKVKEVITIEVNQKSSVSLFHFINDAVDGTTSTSTSTSTATSQVNLTPIPPTNDITLLSMPVPSTADLTSLATKVELMATTPIMIDLKNDIIKKRQPSMKPMRVSAKITAQNLCAFDWQSVHSHNMFQNTDKEGIIVKEALPGEIRDGEMTESHQLFVVAASVTFLPLYLLQSHGQLQPQLY
ncbi:hypothetical protein BDR04DRAFT_1118670 [Suillus decipiens]|nr:hypothetical protein BDR04DRAFT_1118670 [Suillus decipiens]